MTEFKIFLVEDDEWYREMLTYHLTLNPDYEVKKFSNGKDFLDNLYLNPSVVTLDYSLPDIKGEELLKKVKLYNPDIPVIIISGQEDIKTAIKLLKNGAYDYLTKDDETKDRLWNLLLRIKENVSLKNKVIELKNKIEKKYSFDKLIIGNSSPIQRMFSLMEKASHSNITISITGETGTGKELVANAIHYNSQKKDKPFVAINVAAIPKELIESELFGHEKGSFTGAVSRRIGKFEEANQGTIFLDEIGEMESNLQAKLLRVLQEREISRIGSNKPVKIDVRIIVATHKKLANEVKEGNFRQDLYYRLLGLPIEVPPLRERGTDILLLAKYFVKSFCKENNFEEFILSNEAGKKIMKYPFPGNVRELKAIMELAIVMVNNGEIQADDITFDSFDNLSDFLIEETTLHEYNVRIIKHFLKKYDNHAVKVADKLAIGKSTIYRMLKNEKEES